MLFCLFLPFSALASTKAYLGPGAEKLFIEDGKKGEAFVKFEGPTSKWAGKVIKTKVTSLAGGDRFSFDYELELSSGKIKRSYTIVAEGGHELVKGSRVRQVELHFPEGDANKPLKLNHDLDLTKESQKLGLAAEAKKNPYSPDPDAD